VGRLKYCGLDCEGNIHIILQKNPADRFLTEKIKVIKLYQNDSVAVDIARWKPKPKHTPH